MAKVSREYWEIEKTRIPVCIHHEWRYSRRISIGKKEIIVRVPILGSGVSDSSYKTWAHNWLSHQFRKKPLLLSRFKPRLYKTGDQLETADKLYTLELFRVNGSKSKGSVREGKLRLMLSEELSELEQSEATHQLLARLLAKDNIERVSQRIHDINNYYFRKTIKAIRLRNNSSNWGSCSSNGNISISIRSLFAPLEVQDYLYVHELAHLFELNHSSRFWKIVEKVMPDYKKKEHWLRTHGETCTF